VDGTLNFVQHRVVWHAALAAVAVLAVAVRLPEKVATPYLVAEDAAVFLTESLAHGAQALWRPYAGYLHALPRLITCLVSPVPLEHFPSALLVCCVVMMAVVMFCVFRWLMGWREQLTVLGFISLAPFGGYLMLSITNLQWFTAMALALLAVHPDPTPATRWGRAVLLVFATLMALTGPFVVVTLPFFLGMAALHRTPFRVRLAAVQLAAGVVQLVLVATHQRPLELVADPASAAVVSYLADFGPALFGTPSWVAALSLPGKLTVGGLLAGILLAGLYNAVRREGFLNRLLLVGALAGLFAGAGWYRSNGHSVPWFAGERYYVVPYALLLVAFASIMTSALAPRLLRGAALVVVLACWVGYRASVPVDVSAPNWREELAKIPPGGSGEILTWPAVEEWSVFVARDEQGAWLRGESYREIAPPKKPLN
jgi:hypothetical protein